MENVAKITLTDNIEGAKWTKLIANTLTMGPIGMTGLKLGCQRPSRYARSWQFGSAESRWPSEPRLATSSNRCSD